MPKTSKDSFKYTTPRGKPEATTFEGKFKRAMSNGSLKALYSISLFSLIQVNSLFPFLMGGGFYQFVEQSKNKAKYLGAISFQINQQSSLFDKLGELYKDLKKVH